MYYLYLKTPNLTGLKYLGFTSKNPFTYKGSGLYWLRHLNKHGFDISTIILHKCENKQEIIKVGKEYSILWDIVASKEFANLTNEEGNGGAIWLGKKHSAESKRKMSDAKKGIKFTKEHKLKLSKSHKNHTGQKNSFYGKIHSTLSKEKMSKSLKGKVRSNEFKANLSVMYKGKAKIIVECPHCQKTGGKPVMSRYHFDNCKLKHR